MRTWVLNGFIQSAPFHRYPEKKLMTLLGATNLIRDELGDEPEVLRLASFCTDKAVEDPSGSSTLVAVREGILIEKGFPERTSLVLPGISILNPKFTVNCHHEPV